MAKQEVKRLIVIVGATATGKTDLSIDLAQLLHCEIVSADSRQFFRELVIGSAAPSPTQLGMVPHHFVGHLSVTDHYSAITFEQDALRLISQRFQTFDHLLLVGGSGLYIEAICRGFDEIPDTDPEIRISLEKRFLDEGLESLRFQLKHVDPVFYSEADLKNPKRVLRALEVYLTTGVPYSQFRKKAFVPRDFELIKIGLELPRPLLHQRINQRVDLMMELGLEEEVRNLTAFQHLNALNTVGYKELFGYFDGQYDLDTAKELIKRNTRRFARRQCSWFKRDPEIQWFNPEARDVIRGFVHQTLQT